MDASDENPKRKRGEAAVDKNGYPVHHRPRSVYELKDNSNQRKAILKKAHRQKSQTQEEADEEKGRLDKEAEAKFLDSVDNLTEKKASIRVAALDILNEALSFNHLADLVDSRILTLSENLLKNVKQGNAEEVEKACRCLALCAVTIGGAGSDIEVINKACADALKDMMNDGAVEADKRVAVTSALAMITFLNGESDDAISLLEHMKNNCAATKNSKENEDVCAQLAASWGLLASLLPISYLGGAVYHEYVTFFAKLAEEHSCVEVRLAAGENVALLAEAHHHAEEKDMGKKEHKNELIEQDALLDLVNALATDCNKHTSKKDKQLQRATFREVVATVESGDLPSHDLTVGNRKLSVSGWAALLQLDAFKHVLGSGLPFHLSNNLLLAHVLGYDEEDDDDEDFRKDGKANSKRNKKAAYEEHNEKRMAKEALMHGQDEE